jgi:NADH:ubiquinone oxidoreductase subunit 5 (subunit L)/multisubunit Na+/H+ antiporter MnhA subunit
MKLILMLIFWTMVGIVLYNFVGFWGVFAELMFIVLINLLTWDDQMRKFKEKNADKTK